MITKEFAKKLEKKANEGDWKAMFDIAKTYLSGSSDFVTHSGLVINWIIQSADRNHKESQFFLAQCYERGDFIYKDPIMAHLYYNLCATKESKKRLEELEKNMWGDDKREAIARARVKYQNFDFQEKEENVNA